MRLTERIYLVGGGRLGFGLSNAYDCHVYAIDGGSEIALIDAGAGLDLDVIVQRLRFDGLEPSRLRYLLLSHCHADHAGGAAHWHERFRLDVLAHPTTARAVAQADLDAISLRPAIAAGIYPPDYRFLPCPIAGHLTGGDTVRIGDLTLTAYDAPGHAAGQLAFLLDHANHRALFSADAVFHNGRIMLLNTADSDLHAALDTVRRLATLAPHALLPGHLTISLSAGAAEIDRALSAINRLEIPPNLF